MTSQPLLPIQDFCCIGFKYQFLKNQVRNKMHKKDFGTVKCFERGFGLCLKVKSQMVDV